MPLREFADEDGTTWLAWSTVPRSGANVRTAYADGWLSFQAGDGDERRRLAPVPHGWEAASDDELRAYLRRARPSERTEAPGVMAEEAVAQTREEEVAEAVERHSAERTRPEPRAFSVDGGAIQRIKQILRGIRVGRDEGP